MGANVPFGAGRWDTGISAPGSECDGLLLIRSKGDNADTVRVLSNKYWTLYVRVTLG
jgi:hypothetical protein